MLRFQRPAPTETIWMYAQVVAVLSKKKERVWFMPYGTGACSEYGVIGEFQTIHNVKAKLERFGAKNPIVYEVGLSFPRPA